MDINSEGRDVNIIPVLGGFIVRWREDTVVESAKIINVKQPLMVDMPSPLQEVVKKLSAVGQWKTAVRETADGAIKLVKEILIKKMEFLQKHEELLSNTHGGQDQPYAQAASSS